MEGLCVNYMIAREICVDCEITESSVVNYKISGGNNNWFKTKKWGSHGLTAR